MITAIKAKRSIIIFYSIITLIGLISGYKFYEAQPTDTKTTIKEKLDIKENLSYKSNNIFKSIKEILIIFICSITIIPCIINLFNTFYKTFQIGFLYNVLKQINIKLSLTYIAIYKLIPYILIIILTQIGFQITLNIIKTILSNKNNKYLNICRKKIKQFIIISTILITSELITFLYSEILNNYLLTLLNNLWYNCIIEVIVWKH